MKPEKPYPEFPLYSHRSGKWAKKIDGSTKYFGTWDDPDGALAEYRELVRTEGQSVPQSLDDVRELAEPGMTLARAAALFLTAKKEAMESGELAERTYVEYGKTTVQFLELVGRDRRVASIGPTDFSRFKSDRASSRNLVTVGNDIQRVRVWFRWLYESGHLDRPIVFGPDFKRPSKRLMRRHKREKGKMLYSPLDIQLLLDEAGTHLRAMIMLGINCAYGPHDCAMMPLSAIDLDAGIADYPRTKTEIDRVCPLWPETISALAASLQARNRAKTVLGEPAKQRFFVSKTGNAYNNANSDLTKYFDSIRKRTTVAAGGFYWLRHTFETVAGEAKDQVAVDAIMGHADNSIAATYREEISLGRLRLVTEHVREWLFAHEKRELDR